MTLAVGVSIQPRHLARYRDISRLLMKYGRSDLVRDMGLERTLGSTADPDVDRADLPAEATGLADDLERLGPTFIKLGQLLSTRTDLLPPTYTSALTRLQDHIEPIDYDAVEHVVSTELGVRLSKVFPEFDQQPLASASLSQVHRARTRNGRVVAVKVQRPDIREQVLDDLDALRSLAEFLDQHSATAHRYNVEQLLDQFRRSLLDELDFRREAAHMRTLREVLTDHERIVIPEPLDDLTTSRLLTMSYVPGRKLTDLSPLTLLELDGAELADAHF